MSTFTRGYGMDPGLNSTNPGGLWSSGEEEKETQEETQGWCVGLGHDQLQLVKLEKMWGYASKDPNQDWLMSGTSTIINHYQLSSAVVTYHELPYLKNDHQFSSTIQFW